jgi:hypothetical protein
MFLDLMRRSKKYSKKWWGQWLPLNCNREGGRVTTPLTMALLKRYTPYNHTLSVAQ